MNPSRDKGSRFEREIVNELRSAGLDAYRVPLSGAAIGYKGDVHIRLGDRNLSLEAKSRASGFKFIYEEIQGHDLLAIKTDRSEPLLIMRLADAAKLLGSNERKGTAQPASSIESPLELPTIPNAIHI